MFFFFLVSPIVLINRMFVMQRGKLSSQKAALLTASIISGDVSEKVTLYSCRSYFRTARKRMLMLQKAELSVKEWDELGMVRRVKWKKREEDETEKRSREGEKDRDVVCERQTDIQTVSERESARVCKR